jgi:hypothetical protein
MSSRGVPYYMLRNVDESRYVRLAADEYFLVQLMDGQRQVKDLILAYFAEYRSFAFERIAHLVAQLQAHGFLQERPRGTDSIRMECGRILGAPTGEHQRPRCATHKRPPGGTSCRVVARGRSWARPTRLAISRILEPFNGNARGSLVRVACVSASRTWRVGLNYVPGGMMIGWVCMSDCSWLRMSRVKGPRFVLKHCGCSGTCRRTFRRLEPSSVDCGTSASEARANVAFRDGPAVRYR